MRRGRWRKSEVPTGDTQPQLGDTAEDIERRRREREEKEEREEREREERDRQREREMEEEERGEKRERTDTDTDAKSTKSRQKKGQMKSTFLSDSDKEAIVEFIKQHDKTNDSFKDKQKKYGLWEQLAATRKLPVKTVQKLIDTQRTRYGQLTQTKSGQAAEKSTEHQTWLKDSFSFL